MNDTETWTAYLTNGDHHTHRDKIVVIIFQPGPFAGDETVETTIEVADYVMAPGFGADILTRWEGWAQTADQRLAEAGWSHVFSDHWAYMGVKAIAEAIVRRTSPE